MRFKRDDILKEMCIECAGVDEYVRLSQLLGKNSKILDS